MATTMTTVRPSRATFVSGGCGGGLANLKPGELPDDPLSKEVYERERSRLQRRNRQLVGGVLRSRLRSAINFDSARAAVDHLAEVVRSMRRLGVAPHIPGKLALHDEIRALIDSICQATRAPDEEQDGLMADAARKLQALVEKCARAAPPRYPYGVSLEERARRMAGRFFKTSTPPRRDDPAWWRFVRRTLWIRLAKQVGLRFEGGRLIGRVPDRAQRARRPGARSQPGEALNILETHPGTFQNVPGGTKTIYRLRKDFGYHIESVTRARDAGKVVPENAKGWRLEP